MSIEIDDFNPIQEKYFRKREPKLKRLLDDKEIFAIEQNDSKIIKFVEDTKVDCSRRFTINYANGQKFKCSGPLANRCIKTTFCREIIKKRKLF